jgi:hypothetical protein
MANTDYSKYILNYKKRGHNDNDIFYNPLKTLSVDTTRSHSLKDKIPFVFNQENMGCCASNAIALYIAYLNNNYIPSRLFIYYNARLLSNVKVNEDTGVGIYDVCNSVNKYPPCQEILWKYDINNLPIKPSNVAYSTPIELNNFSYLAVNTDMEHIKSIINEELPILIGITIYSSFYNGNNTGIIEYPNIANDELKGEHCVLLVGYDDNTQTVICANSWGKRWGNNGFFTLPYTYVLDTNICHDFYIIRFTNTDINTSNTNDKNCINKCILT